MMASLVLHTDLLVNSSHCNSVKKVPKEDVSHAVMVRSLGNMVKWLSNNNNYLLKREFKDIGESLQLSKQEALLPYNTSKNRYNCVTYDHSRVKLQFTGEDGSDYINASWIMGEGGRMREYIAAQAPLQGTVGDMWRMVWEYRVDVIMMITTLTEDGTEKCVQYWPESVGGSLCVASSRVGVELKMTLKSRETHTDWEHRVITVEEVEDTVMPGLTVHHYHFTDWPDRGVPSSPATLLHFLHHIHTTHTTPTPRQPPLPTNSSLSHHPLPPLLVHCSAGVGRTGTLLAVDRLLKQMQAGAERVNVLQTVRELRMSRPGMVQNLEQYKFIYSCLAHMQSCGLAFESSNLAADHDTTSANSDKLQAVALEH